MKGYRLLDYANGAENGRRRNAGNGMVRIVDTDSDDNDGEWIPIEDSSSSPTLDDEFRGFNTDADDDDDADENGGIKNALEISFLFLNVVHFFFHHR